MVAVKNGVVEAASAILTLPGQTESGDRHIVAQVPQGVLAAVVDGLGHGPEAAAVAERAIGVLGSYANSEPLPALVRRCHNALGGTRGVVMSLAVFEVPDQTMTWLGVGDVEGRLLIKIDKKRYAPESLLLRPGVVGQRLPPLKPSVARVARGDLVIFATDGIDPNFAENLSVDNPPEAIANHIVKSYSKRTDDALALVVRYLG
jgi:negative regulator of sigma-B (phosphoserine phosphatase)